MRILGIESSCDETACAVVDDGVRVLSNVIASQHDLHEEYRGVVPEIASRAHVERLLPTLRAALRDAGCGLDSVDVIAVGNRPGLIGSLLVGVAAAKALALALGVPVVGVDHIHAHLWAGALGATAPEFPALGLVVSGGHTAIFRCQSPVRVERIGTTIDDAIGEAYDKAAVVLGLPYPGGPRIDKLARNGDAWAHRFPVSALDEGSLNFSFSGLKTALLYAVRGKPVREGKTTTFERDHTSWSEAQLRDFAASFQKAAVDAALLKLGRAFDRQENAGCRTLLVGGGVSANSLLRSSLIAFAGDRGLELRLPAMPYCMDNAAMIAGLAHRQIEELGADDLTLSASPNSVTQGAA
ncbi:MAG: tRNA (adenosine(37)-N6)-threonylcarbamoyltransferase complex transferase subunit TsaD [Phycisphaeraceae bacterium]|nr:tRNA (adenosine(37)-N6)-threonylcarbamoyltransferase complex transferase subunit TsaD [Phycisphaeraceae bacterium]